MFRKMRRFKQELTKEDSEKILQNGKSGVMAVSGDCDYPYAVPLSYAYEGGRIFFHSAKTGHKLDGIQHNPKVSFCVIDQDQVVPEKFTTYFRSVVAFGKAKVIMEDDLKRHAMELLVHKYSPGLEEAGAAEIEHDWNLLCVVEIEIEHLSGKESMELIRARK